MTAVQNSQKSVLLTPMQRVFSDSNLWDRIWRFNTDKERCNFISVSWHYNFILSKKIWSGEEGDSYPVYINKVVDSFDTWKQTSSSSVGKADRFASILRSSRAKTIVVIDTPHLARWSQLSQQLSDLIVTSYTPETGGTFARYRCDAIFCFAQLTFKTYKPSLLSCEGTTYHKADLERGTEVIFPKGSFLFEWNEIFLKAVGTGNDASDVAIMQLGNTFTLLNLKKMEVTHEFGSLIDNDYFPICGVALFKNSFFHTSAGENCVRRWSLKTRYPTHGYKMNQPHHLIILGGTLVVASKTTITQFDIETARVINSISLTLFQNDFIRDLKGVGRVALIATKQAVHSLCLRTFKLFECLDLARFYPLQEIDKIFVGAHQREIAINTKCGDHLLVHFPA